MKKLLTAIMALVLLVSFAYAEDLSAYSFDELIETSREIVKEIMSRDEWKEATVPAGEWIIGEDIPEGTYGLSAPKHMCIVTIWQSKEQNTGELVREFIVYEDDPVARITLQDGWFVVLSQSIVITPPKGIEF